MSYILDALKKSERERSLGHVPTLNTVYSDPQRAAKRRWFWLVLALLILLTLVAAAIYGAMFWGQNRAFWSAGEQSQTPAAEAPPSTVNTKKLESKSVTTPAVAIVGTPRAKIGAPGAARPPVSRSAAAVQTSTSYPTIDDLDDGTRQRLSDIVINAISYSKQPSRRFVMINQKIYRQGQSVNGQISVVEIRPQGAVLRFQGREFLAVP